jgi:soluble lytic murein transglycosylase
MGRVRQIWRKLSEGAKGLREKPAWKWLACLGAALILILIAFFVARSRLRLPQDLYREAQEATPRRAVAIYKRLEGQFPEIKEYLRLEAARATMPDIDAVAQLQAVIAFRPHSPAAYEAHLTLARYYADIGEEQAEEEYRAALELEESAALRLELARYLEERGSQAEAYKEYRRLLSSHPDAFAGMRRLGSDPIEVATDLDRATYFSDALETLRLTDDPEAIPLRAQALAGLGRYEEAVRAYRRWLPRKPDDQDAQLRLARALEQSGQKEAALKAYQAVDTPDSLLAQAGLLEDTEPDQAIDIYLDSPYPVAWWNATWLLESEGRLEEALELYARLAQTDTYFADDAAYRMFILAQRLDDTKVKKAALELLAKFPSSFLAVRAEGSGLELAVTPPFGPAGQEIIEKAQILDRLGLSDWARRELVMAAKFHPDPAVGLAMAQALAERGVLLDSQAIAEKLIQELERAPLALWRLSYPKAYPEEVETAAAEFGGDPLLILSIMREESHYDPEAISRANAQGLMQILPSTRDWIAEELGEKISSGQIFAPLTNIRFGAWHLRFLLDHFEGDVELAVAAYNGGLGNVESWQEDPRVKDKDDFLRWIGFGETREYVEKVLFSYEVYQKLETLEEANH